MRARTRRCVAFALACAGALLLAGCASAPPRADDPAPRRPSSAAPAPDLDRGRTLAAACLACHGETEIVLDGDVRPPKLRGQRQSYLFRALLDYRDGRRDRGVMGPFVDALDVQAMRDVSAYLGGPEATPHKVNRGDGIAYARNAAVCGFCHAETGMGVMENLPILAGQRADYLARALRDYRSGRRVDPTMTALARTLDDADIERMAAYFAAQTALEVAR